MHFTPSNIDLDRFQELCDALIAPTVTRTQPVRLFHNRWRDETLIDLSIKTSRAPGGCGPDDCDGSSPPSSFAMEAAQRIADDLGLKVKWEPSEKGWGSFYWETKD